MTSPLTPLAYELPLVEAITNFLNRVDKLDWEQECCLLAWLGTNTLDGIERTEVECTRCARDNRGRFRKGGCGSFFAVSVNNVTATFTFSFGLLGHGALHISWKLNVLNFHILYINTPLRGLLINNFFNFVANFLALRKQFVEFKVA